MGRGDNGFCSEHVEHEDIEEDGVRSQICESKGQVRDPYRAYTSPTLCKLVSGVVLQNGPTENQRIYPAKCDILFSYE